MRASMKSPEISGGVSTQLSYCSPKYNAAYWKPVQRFVLGFNYGDETGSKCPVACSQQNAEKQRPRSLDPRNSQIPSMLLLILCLGRPFSSLPTCFSIEALIAAEALCRTVVSRALRRRRGIPQTFPCKRSCEGLTCPTQHPIVELYPRAPQRS